MSELGRLPMPPETGGTSRKHDEEEGAYIGDLHRAVVRERGLPPEGEEAAPLALWIAIFAVMLLGAFYAGRFGGSFDSRPHLVESPPTSGPAEAQPPDGRQVFVGRCASCHQSTGAGVPGQYPPLANSEFVTGPADRTISIVLFGLEGAIRVNGADYAGAMPGWGNRLTPEEIAAVVTHIRGNFGNAASPVTVEDVKRVAAASPDRKSPLTPADLK